MNDSKNNLDDLLQNNTNPFDGWAGSFFILKNEMNQQSLWPSFIDTPNGWIKEFGPATREECLSQAKQDKPCTMLQ